VALASQITLDSIAAPQPARAAVLAAAADEDLMDGFARSADEALFEELVRRYTPAAYRAALAMLSDAGAAADAVQEGFLHLVRARRGWRPGAVFRSWLFAILRNVCRDELRRAARPEPPAAAPAGPPEPLARLQAREQAAAAARAFAELPESDREVLALRIHGGLEFAQIAAACGLSTAAAKKRACRALELLRRRLSARHPAMTPTGQS